jgi:hypothetical protein
MNLDGERAGGQTLAAAMQRFARLPQVTLFALSVATVAGCKPPDEDLTHGYVKVRLSGDREVFAGTNKVQLRLKYDDCLTNFYQTRPNWTQEGADGFGVFGTREEGEGWRERLCELNVTDLADCEVTNFEQQLDPAAPSKGLLVEYQITGEIANQVLAFGPMPTPEGGLISCMDGNDPVVEFQSGAAQGYNGNAQLWSSVSASPDSAIPRQGTGAEMRITCDTN